MCRIWLWHFTQCIDSATLMYIVASDEAGNDDDDDDD